VALLAALARDLSGASAAGGKEINWQEFCTSLLESGEVARIVVVNNKTARVVLRRRGEAGPERAAGSSDSKGAAPGASSSWSAEDAAGNDDGSAAEGRGRGGRLTPLAQDPTGQAAYFFSIGSVESFERKLEAAQKELGIASRDFIPVQYVSETSWSSQLGSLAPTLLLVGAYFVAMRFMGGGGAGGGAGGGMGGMFQMGKSKAKRVRPEDVNVTFKDVAGCGEAKKEIMEFVEFLKDASRFTKLGAKIPKGALLCGPPGTGKTLLAKATAGEANVPFYSISGSDFIEMFVGVGPSRVRDLFKEARANAPCIVFIDEIDAVGRKRGGGGMGGNDERENTLNQLLVEMDGFGDSTNIVVLAGTNRVDVLDPALTRPGRFDRQITVDRPDIAGRKEIFEVHLKGLTLAAPLGEYSGRLAGLTPGFAGADIANICNEAAIVAARLNRDAIELVDFEAALDRVIGGLETGKLITPLERKTVAYHEAGHAVAGWFLEHADPILKVTIVPRGGGALGFAQYLPKEVMLRTESQINDMICMALAGRAAEEVQFGKVTTGASNDLERVTQLIYQMIQVYGFSKIGQLAFPPDRNQGGFPKERAYSDSTAQAMDEEAKRMIDTAYARTLVLMSEKRNEVAAIAELLLSKETITHDDIVDTIGHRPFTPDDQYSQYISNALGIKTQKEKEAREKAGKEAEEPEGGIPPNLAPI
jgi:AFG3 family protein